MATFKFGRTVDIHWNGYDIQGPAETVFSIPDQLYEEFDGDIAPVEPTLVWLDTNEFQTLQNAVSGSLTLVGSTPIDISVNSNTSTISINSGTNPNGYLLAANGSGGVIFTPASTSGLTSVVGISPISTVISGGTVSVSIDQTALSASDATTATTLRTYVKNSSGSTITKGQVVYITGADGTNALIGLASNTSDDSSSKTLGIAANTMTNNAFGYVIENGQLSNIDTSAATAGAAVWLGSTPGSYQFTVPAEPNHAVYLGVVTKTNASTGEILVKVQNGYELNELHDVFTTSVSSSLPLVYSTTSSGWIAQALSSVGIADGAVTSSKVSSVTGAGNFVLGTGPTLSLPVIDNPKIGYATTAQSATTATLTNSSPYYQFFTGNATGLTIQLPVASTMALGQGFEFNNNGSQLVTITSSGGNTVASMGQNSSFRILCILTSGTGTSSWDSEVVGASTATGTGSVVLSVSPTFTGRPTFADGIAYTPTVISSAGTTTALSATGEAYVRVTGTTTQTLTLPSNGILGQWYIIRNDSTGVVTVNASGGALAATIAAGQSAQFLCLTANGTVASDWGINFLVGAGSINSAAISAGAVNTAKIDSTGGSNGWVLTADGSGGATFAASSGGSTLISFNTYTAAATLALTDLDKIVQGNSTAAFTITVPPNSSVAFSVGSQITILQIGTGQVTIAGGSGVTVNGTPGLKMRAQWSSATLVQRSANTWTLLGDTSA